MTCLITATGSCPLPRHRISEISFVLQALATLLASLKKSTAGTAHVDSTTWVQIIDLYPALVDVGCSSGDHVSPQLWRALKDVLLQYSSLLRPPNSNAVNGNLF